MKIECPYCLNFDDVEKFDRSDADECWCPMCGGEFMLDDSGADGEDEVSE